jgi:hypothetical protein
MVNVNEQNAEVSVLIGHYQRGTRGSVHPGSVEKRVLIPYGN